MKVNLAALLSFLNSLPLVRNLPTKVKKVLGDILSVAVALAAVLSVAVALAPSLHIGAVDQSYLVAAGSFLAAAIALLRREVQATAARQVAPPTL